MEKRSKSQTFTTIFVPKRPTSKSIRSTFGLDEEEVGGQKAQTDRPKANDVFKSNGNGEKV